MNRLQSSRLLARLPVRWRLALASAILTLAILVAFALVVGRLTTDRIRDILALYCGYRRGAGRRVRREDE